VALRTALTDIVLKRIVSRRNCAPLLQAHGRPGIAAVAKRQLNAAPWPGMACAE
jgi:hypothetical protein